MYYIKILVNILSHFSNIVENITQKQTYLETFISDKTVFYLALPDAGFLTLINCTNTVLILTQKIFMVSQEIKSLLEELIRVLLEAIIKSFISDIVLFFVSLSTVLLL